MLGQGFMFIKISVCFIALICYVYGSMEKSGFLIFMFFVFIGCGSSSSDGTGGSTTVSGTASFLNGPTPAVTSTSINAIKTSGLRKVSATPSDGNWLLSPDQMILTLASIDLTTDSGSTSGTLSDSACTITYDRSQVGLA